MSDRVMVKTVCFTNKIISIISISTIITIFIVIIKIYMTRLSYKFLEIKPKLVKTKVRVSRSRLLFQC